MGISLYALSAPPRWSLGDVANLPEPIARLQRVLQDLPRQRVVEVVERQVEQAEHLVAPRAHPLDQAPRRVRRVHRLGLVPDVGALGRRLAPILDVRVQVRQDELHRSGLAVGLARFGAAPAGLARGRRCGRERLVQDLLDKGRRTAPAGAKVNEGVVEDGGAEGLLEDFGYDRRGGALLEEGDLGGLGAGSGQLAGHFSPGIDGERQWDLRRRSRPG